MDVIAARIGRHAAGSSDAVHDRRDVRRRRRDDDVRVHVLLGDCAEVRGGVGGEDQRPGQGSADQLEIVGEDRIHRRRGQHRRPLRAVERPGGNRSIRNVDHAALDDEVASGIVGVGREVAHGDELLGVLATVDEPDLEIREVRPQFAGQARARARRGLRRGETERLAPRQAHRIRLAWIVPCAVQVPEPNVADATRYTVVVVETLTRSRPVENED